MRLRLKLRQRDTIPLDSRFVANTTGAPIKIMVVLLKYGIPKDFP